MTREEAVAISDGVSALRIPHVIEVGFHNGEKHMKVVLHPRTLRADTFADCREVAGRHQLEFGFFGGEFTFRTHRSAQGRLQ